MKTKSRILAFLLGFIIIFNISFARPQTVEAYVGVGVDIALQAIFQYVCGRVFSDAQTDIDYTAMAEEFSDYYQAAHAITDSSSYYYKYQAVNNSLSFLFDAAEYAKVVKSVYEFLESKGEFTSEGYAYTPVVSSGTVTPSNAINHLSDVLYQYFPEHSDNIINVMNSATSAGFIDGKYCSIGTFLTNDNLQNTIYWGMGYSGEHKRVVAFGVDTVDHEDFDDFADKTYFYSDRNGNFTYTKGQYASLHSFCDDFTFLYSLFADSGASDVSSDPVNVSLTNDGHEFASDPDTYAEKVAANATGTTVVHHTDGTKEVKEGVEVDVPVTSTGEGEYSPDATRDTTINKPASDVYGDEGTLTDGAVSIDSKIVSMPGDIAAAISDTYGDGKVDFDDFKITKDITTTFPFSLPWDIYRVLHIFQTDPKVPVFEFDFGQYYPFNQVPAGSRDNLVFRLDLSEFSDLIAAEKFFVTIFYALGLITATRSKMIRG